MLILQIRTPIYNSTGNTHFSLQTQEGHSRQKQTASKSPSPGVRLYTLKKRKCSIFCHHEHFSSAIYMNFDPQHSDSFVTMIPLNVQPPCSTYMAKKKKVKSIHNSKT